MNKELLRKYAKLAVCSGANIQPGQLLVITASVKDYEFVTMCVEEAYKAKASLVHVDWSNEDNDKLTYEYASIETLTEVPQWKYDKREYAQNKGCAYLHIISDTPGLMKDIDPEKIKAARIATMKKMKPLREYTMANRGQWSIVALPSSGWAKRVFPDLEETAAIEALWKAIFTSVRLSENNDPVAEWKEHDEKLAHYAEVLNNHQFEKLHFKNSIGTDLYVGLVKNHVWAGGASFTDKGVIFNPNMPTEEVFCMPHKDNVEGKVVASKPLSYSGKVIQDFWFEFKKGRVENYGAKTELATLTDLLNTDEGSRHIGEVALISYNSPISLMNVLFYETLFDENASCHLALGDSYPENVEGGLEMNEEQLAAAGGNSSMNHVDFMFGTKDMSVVGIKEDGSEVTIFENGNFVF